MQKSGYQAVRIMDYSFDITELTLEVRN